MKTIRRFYFYLISLISLQVVIWSVVNLLRTIFDTTAVNNIVDWLAGGIAFVVVAVPVFWLHWTTVQRDAQKDEEEGSSQIRSIFLYTIPLASGIPIVYALLAIFNRLITQALGLSVSEAALGGSQTHIDNLIAIAANLVILVYFWRILQQDWRSVTSQEHLTNARRLHRYLWMLFGLGLFVVGVQQILRFIFFTPSEFGSFSVTWLATGLSLLLVGLPIWLRAWNIILTSLVDDFEQKSLLRLIILYLLTFLGIGFSLTSLGIIVANLFRWLFQVDSWTVRSFLDQHAVPLSLLISMGFVWFYFRRELHHAIIQNGDELRQASLKRIFNSILSFAGLVISFLGLTLLLGAIIDSVFGRSIGNQAGQISDAFALLIIGLPLWLYYWLIIQKEIGQDDEISNSARKSLIRRGYLYLALFATVVGSMISIGWWIYGILDALLGNYTVDFWQNFFLQLRIAFLFVLFLIYHLRVLRADGRRTVVPMVKETATYSVRILQSDLNDLSEEIIHAIQLKAPHLSAKITSLDQLTTEFMDEETDLLVIPSQLTGNYPQPLAAFLQDYQGKVLSLPGNNENWYWLGTQAKDPPQLVNDTVTAIQRLSKNLPISTSSSGNPWLIAVYIMAGLFVFQLMIMLIAMLASFFLN
ncbi:MAG TPA: DUF5671 domain-containing protein [Anaerolineaceae bacterium]|nr:DUF5671 domain-containing protein [Anaerolineaceae bacterium]